MSKQIMEGVVARIVPVKVCPVCGRQETLAFVKYARCDYKCRGCGETHLSQFLPSTIVFRGRP